jgi:hypothetical protein
MLSDGSQVRGAAADGRVVSNFRSDPGQSDDGQPTAEVRTLGVHRGDMLVVMSPLVVVIASQLLFTAGDLLARLKMRQHGFDAGAFVSWWFAGYMLVRTLATFGQLWVLSKLVLGQTLPLFAAASVVLSMLLSVTVLNEGLTTKTVVGGSLAVAALVALTLPS